MRNPNDIFFSVGDRVRVRDWDDMENEYGVDDVGTILCACGFPKAMEQFCGREFTIESIKLSNNTVEGLEGATYWLISLDMIEHPDFADYEEIEESNELWDFLSGINIK